MKKYAVPTFLLVDEERKTVSGIELLLGPNCYRTLIETSPMLYDQVLMHGVEASVMEKVLEEILQELAEEDFANALMSEEVM